MFERIFHDGGGGEGRETKPHPQPLPEEGGGVISRGNGGGCLRGSLGWRRF